MQVNHAIKLRYASDRPALAKLLRVVGRERPDLEATALDGPLGQLGLPIWTSVIFSAAHGHHDALVSSIGYSLDAAGVANRFEEWP
jgi:hypothetical protein